MNLNFCLEVLQSFIYHYRLPDDYRNLFSLSIELLYYLKHTTVFESRFIDQLAIHDTQLLYFFFIFLYPYCYPFCLSTLHHAEICLLYFLNCILIFLFIFLHFSTKFSEKIPQRVSLFSDNENNFNIVSFFLCRNKVLIEQIIKEMVKLIAASHLKI